MSLPSSAFAEFVYEPTFKAFNSKRYSTKIDENHSSLTYWNNGMPKLENPKLKKNRYR